MPISFPHPSEADEDGILAVGGDLTPKNLIEAYLNGIFPWPISKHYPLLWFSPDPRGIIKIENIHFPKRFLRFIKKTSFQIKINQDFEKIIQHCKDVPRADQSGTWILDGIIKGYTELFKQEKAYCIGVYNKTDELIGGLYGVVIGEIVSGESMFHLEDNASKLALYTLLEIIRHKNIPFLDIQMLTSLTESFGGEYVSRSEYLKLLESLDSKKLRSQIFSL